METKKQALITELNPKDKSKNSKAKLRHTKQDERRNTSRNAGGT